MLHFILVNDLNDASKSKQQQQQQNHPALVHVKADKPWFNTECRQLLKINERLVYIFIYCKLNKDKEQISLLTKDKKQFEWKLKRGYKV